MKTGCFPSRQPERAERKGETICGPGGPGPAERAQSKKLEGPGPSLSEACAEAAREEHHAQVGELFTAAGPRQRPSGFGHYRIGLYTYVHVYWRSAENLTRMTGRKR